MNMKKFKIICTLLVILLTCTSCKKADDTTDTAYTELTMHEPVEPYSDWGKSPMGSVKYLDGKTVFVSIFMEDINASWTSDEKAFVKDNMNTVNDFFINEGKRYGRGVKLIYDIDENPDLEYHMRYSKSVDRGANKDLVYDVNEFIRSEIPIKDLMKKYQADSIGFLVFVDTEYSENFAFPYWYDSNINYYEETAFISLRWKLSNDNANNRVWAETYAHEILHLFGARDLYYTDRDLGISRELIDYVREEFPKDVMFSDTYTNSLKDIMSQEISKLTAYFIGWNNYIYELEQFPSIKTDKPAVYAKVKKAVGNYDNYTYTPKNNKMAILISNIMGIAVVLLIICFMISDIVSLIKYKDYKKYILSIVFYVILLVNLLRFM